MRSIEQLTDQEAHKLYCVAMGIRDDLNQNLSYKRIPNSIRITKKDQKDVLFHLHYYRPGISGTVFDLSMRARNYEGEAATIQVVSAIRYLEEIGISLTALPVKKSQTVEEFIGKKGMKKLSDMGVSLDELM